MKQITFEQLNDLKKNGNKILADFFIPNCGPCKMLLPFLESLETEYPDITFVKIDASTDSMESAKYGIRVAPTILFFSGENVVNRLTGSNNSKSKYTEIIETL